MTSDDLLFKQPQQAIVTMFSNACCPEVTHGQHIKHTEQHDEGKANTEREIITGRQPCVVQKQWQETVDNDKDKMLSCTFDDRVCTMRATVVEPH